MTAVTPKFHYRPSVEIHPARTPGKIALNMKFVLSSQQARDASVCLYVRRVEPGDVSAARVEEVLQRHAAALSPRLRELALELEVFESDTE